MKTIVKVLIGIAAGVGIYALYKNYKAKNAISTPDTIVPPSTNSTTNPTTTVQSSTPINFSGVSTSNGSIVLIVSPSLINMFQKGDNISIVAGSYAGSNGIVQNVDATNGYLFLNIPTDSTEQAKGANGLALPGTFQKRITLSFSGSKKSWK